MREPRSVRRGGDAGDSEKHESRQVNVAEARRRQAFAAQALKHVARGAGKRDRKAVCRGGADCTAKRHFAPREERNGEKCAARGKQASQRANQRASGEESRTA